MSENQNPEDNEFLKKFQSDIDSEESFQEKTQFVEQGLDGKKKGPIAKIWDKVLSLWAFVRSDQVPWTQKVLPLAGLVYLVSPIDLIPDVIPVAGLLDDAGVIGLIVSMMGSMLVSFAVASAVIHLAVLTADVVDSWIQKQRAKHIGEAEKVVLTKMIKDALDSGNVPEIHIGLYDAADNELEGQTWEVEKLAPELQAEFGRKNKIVYELA